ncbi:hypothetical protein TNCV_3664381 [Trichonephila clavipes]|nr:hypothetical protein TNCV_3664381 [Trichonephila clavipes]
MFGKPSSSLDPLIYFNKPRGPDPQPEFVAATKACRRTSSSKGWEKKVNHDEMTDLIKRSPRQNGEGGRTPKHETLYRSRAPAGRGEERRKERGTAEGSESKAVIYHPRTQSRCESRHFGRTKLDTLREDCGIIRKQASTDGGVLWKVMCVDVVQVRRKDRSLRDPREASSRVRI